MHIISPILPHFHLIILSLIGSINPHLIPQARVSFSRIESFLARMTDDVHNDGVNGNKGSDRHCPDLAKGQLKIENGAI